MSDSEAAYLLNRAEEEAIAAIRADHPAASASHQQLSIFYSAKALIKLRDSDGHPPEVEGIFPIGP